MHSLVITLLAVLLAGTASASDAPDPPRQVFIFYVNAEEAVVMLWLPVDGATGYRVLRSETAGGAYSEIASMDSDRYLDETVEPGNKYFYVTQVLAGPKSSIIFAKDLKDDLPVFET